MAEIDNPQNSKFCNDDLRPIADKLQYLVAKIPELVGTYNARDLGTIITAAGAEKLVTDGSVSDGRTRVAGGDVFNLVTLLQDLDAFFTKARKDVLLKWKEHGV